MKQSTAKQRRFAPQLSKKTLIVVASLLLLVVVGSYSYLSMAFWDKYNDDMQATRQSLKQAVATLAHAQGTMEHRTAAEQLVQQSSIEAVCTIPWWYGWQQSINRQLRSDVDQCGQFEQQIKQINVAADTLVHYYEAEDNMAQLLAGLIIDNEQVDQEDWEAISGKVEQIRESVRSFDSSSDAFNEVNALSLKTVSSIASSWQSLQDAHKDKNRDKYEASIDSLDNSYQQLKTVVERSNEQRTLLQREVAIRANQL
jgi:hypothetical protein